MMLLFGVVVVMVMGIATVSVSLRQRPRPEKHTESESCEEGCVTYNDLSNVEVMASGGRFMTSKVCPVGGVLLLLVVALSIHFAILNNSYISLRKFHFVFSNVQSFPEPASKREIANCSQPPLDLRGVYYGNTKNCDKNHSAKSNLRKLYFSSMDAQELFDQGLLHLHGFNQIEAIRNFEAALVFDTSCFICHWGIAQAWRANINTKMSERKYYKGRLSILEAKRTFDDVSMDMNSAERSIISRLFNATSEGFSPTFELYMAHGHNFYEMLYNEQLGSLYKDAKESVVIEEMSGFSAYSVLVDVGVLLAESLLNLTPWKYFDLVNDVSDSADGSSKVYDANFKEVRLNTLALEAVKILESILCIPTHSTMLPLNHDCRDHPLGLHLYIHIMEQIDNPELAVAAADRLRDIMSSAPMGHLVHMPAHIYMRTGDFANCMKSSLAAVENDIHLIEQCLQPYLPTHNTALMVTCALYAGEMKRALAYSMPASNLDYSVTRGMNSMYAVPIDLILIRFGKYEEVLGLSEEVSAKWTENAPNYLHAVFLYAQLLATIAVMGTTVNWFNQLHNFEKAVAAIQPSEIPISHHFYSYQREMGQLMNLTVHASLAVHKKRFMDAVTFFLQGVALQDTFSYMEPENFYFPLRQCLAVSVHLLLTHPTSHGSEWTMPDVIDLYSMDLLVHPNNYWALRALNTLNKSKMDFGGESNDDITNSCCEIGLC